jgi:hypothetical protein
LTLTSFKKIGKLLPEHYVIQQYRELEGIKVYEIWLYALDWKANGRVIVCPFAAGESTFCNWK